MSVTINLSPPRVSFDTASFLPSASVTVTPPGNFINAIDITLEDPKAYQLREIVYFSLTYRIDRALGGTVASGTRYRKYGFLPSGYTTPGYESLIYEQNYENATVQAETKNMFDEFTNLVISTYSNTSSLTHASNAPGNHAFTNTYQQPQSGDVAIREARLRELITSYGGDSILYVLQSSFYCQAEDFDNHGNFNYKNVTVGKGAFSPQVSITLQSLLDIVDPGNGGGGGGGGTVWTPLESGGCGEWTASSFNCGTWAVVLPRDTAWTKGNNC